MDHTSGVRITDIHGKTLATSKNLRGVLRYARGRGVSVVTCEDFGGDGEYAVTFYYHGGARGVTKWADCRVFLQWLLQHGRLMLPDRLTLAKRIYDIARHEYAPGKGLTYHAAFIRHGVEVTYR